MKYIIFLGLLSPSLFAAAEINGGKVVFSIEAPKAVEVKLKGQWDKREIVLTQGIKGIWRSAAIIVPTGVWEYSFQVDGINMLDPQNPAIKPQRQPQKSVLHLPATPPAAWDWQGDIPHGTVHTHVFHSKLLGVLREGVVYTPLGYETSKDSLPLLVLQHGAGDNQRAWTEHGKAHWILDSLIAAKKAKPMIVLMLDGHPRGTASRSDSLEAFRQELFEEAIPLIEANYRVLPGQENRAMAGLSMGGWQSLTIGLNAVDRFAWIGCFSSAVESESLRGALEGNENTNMKLRLLWIACGRDDLVLKRTMTLVEDLKAAKVNHDWHLTDGDHSWRVWRQYLTEFVPRLFQH